MAPQRREKKKKRRPPAPGKEPRSIEEKGNLPVAIEGNLPVVSTTSMISTPIPTTQKSLRFGVGAGATASVLICGLLGYLHAATPWALAAAAIPVVVAILANAYPAIRLSSRLGSMEASRETQNPTGFVREGALPTTEGKGVRSE